MQKVYAKGTCESFPCAVGSWRCAECTALLVKTYAGVVSGLHDKALQDDAEKEVRNRSVWGLGFWASEWFAGERGEPLQNAIRQEMA